MTDTVLVLRMVIIGDNLNHCFYSLKLKPLF